VERNTAFVAARAETKTEIGTIDAEPGVRIAVLVDLDGRIMAPAVKMNQHLVAGVEGLVTLKARDRFRGGEETGFALEADEQTVVAVEPLKILSAQAGRNVIVGMAVVSLDTTLATPDFGEMGMAYSESIIATGVIGLLVLLVLYRLTLKPFEVLNDDIDKVLKGDIPQVTNEFKFEEMDQLFEVINSALQRVPKGGAPGGGADVLGGPAGPSVDEYAGPARMLSNLVKFGMVVLDGDRKILHMNSMFEEITGIRSDNAIGQDIPTVARDQAFGAFSNDVFDRATAGTEGISEDFDFSGVGFKMYAASFGAPGATARCYVLCAVRNEG
jgi:PAS domain-containing protein